MKLLLLIFFLSLKSFSAEQDKIIGSNDLVTVSADGSNIPIRHKVLLNAIGLLSSRGCTVTHIGNGYALTAGHCFDATENLIKDQPCGDFTIAWGLRKGISSYLESRCERIIAAQRSDLNDFAIIRIYPEPDSAADLELNRKAAPGDELTVFSHSGHLSLQWSKNCVVEALTSSRLPKGSLNHKCDTDPGSSGAALIDTYTGKIVGIHAGGTSTGGGMNYGTFITNSEIADILRELGFK